MHMSGSLPCEASNMQKAAPADAAMGKRRICKRERDFAGVGFARCGRWGRVWLSGKCPFGCGIDIAGVPPERLMSALPIANRKTAYNSSGRIDQTKAVGFVAWVARRDLTCTRLGSRDCVFCVGQDRGFPLDRNASAQPIDCKQRGLLALTIAEAS